MAPDPKEGIMSRAFWFAVLVYLIPTFLLGYFWHLVTLRHHYERLALYRDRVVIPLGLASMVIQAVAFAWLYPRIFSTDRAVWLESGLQFGVIFGLLAWSFTTLPVAAKYKMTSVGSFLVLESAFTAVQFIVVSPLIALAWRNPG
jgi:hypothetical protein